MAFLYSTEAKAKANTSAKHVTHGLGGINLGHKKTGLLSGFLVFRELITQLLLPQLVDQPIQRKPLVRCLQRGNRT